MGNFYNRKPEETIITEENNSGLKTTVIKYAASFSIGIYRGRYRVVYVYRSPYQRKYQNYMFLNSEKLKRQLSELEEEAITMMEAEEQLLMHDYKSIFENILKEFPKPSYPISAL